MAARDAANGPGENRGYKPMKTLVWGQVGFQYGKSLLQLFPMVPVRVGRRGWGWVVGLLLCFIVSLPVANTSAQVPLNELQTFDARPPATSWATAALGAGPSTYSTAAQLDAAVQNLTASSITRQLATALSSRDANSLVRWNSTLHDVQIRPANIAYQVLLATLVNNTGTNIASVTITYTLSASTGSNTVIGEEVPGQMVFWSLTGASNSWTLIPELSTNAPVAGTSKVMVGICNVGSWTNGSPLYLLWADDNAAANQDGSGTEEGAYIIDNFLAMPGGTIPPLGISIQPVSTNVLQCTTLWLTCVATGSPPPFSYHWFKEGAEIDTDPFWGGNVTATSPTFVISNISLGDAASNFGYNCRVRNIWGEAWSDYAKVDVIADAQGPRLLSVFGPSTNLLQIELTFDEPILEVDATSAFNYTVLSEDGREWGVTNAILDASGKMVTLELTVERNPALRYNVIIYANSIHDRCNATGNLDINATVNVEVPLLTIDDGKPWRYNQDGVDLGTAWRNPTFNDSNWASGQAVFDGVKSQPGGRATVSGQVVRTPLSVTNALWPIQAIPTYYFRVHFFFWGNPRLSRLRLTPLIDDGAIFYLNGQEAARYRVNPGTPVPFDAYCQAVSTNTSAVGTAGFGQPINLPLTNVVQGDNVLAIELKQWNATDGDITMGLILSGEVNGDYWPPMITQNPPATVTIIEGQTARFSVSASGTDLHYQWYKNGSPILNATNATYTISNAACADSGSYTVHVWNACTCPELVSTASVLTVRPEARLQIGYQAQGPAATISWSGAGWVLQEAPAVTGPWEDSADQNNPQSRSVAAGSARFFRMR